MVFKTKHRTGTQGSVERLPNGTSLEHHALPYGLRPLKAYSNPASWERLSSDMATYVRGGEHTSYIHIHTC